MEKEEGCPDSNNASGPPSPHLCDECHQNPSKYKCPGCTLRTCSLPCVKAHKQRTNCTGKRSTTHFVSLSQFDDDLLISDYNFLEEVKRVAESSQRMRDGLCGQYGFRLPLRLKLLRNAAYRRKTQVLILPSGMSKREKNRSRYDQKKKSIFWTIEWHFHSTDVVLVDHGVDENKSLRCVIEEHLRPSPWNHKLRPFCKEQLESLKFFIRKNPKGPKFSFRLLDIEAPLSQQLSEIVIVEYPIIHVFLPSHSCDFEIEKAGPKKIECTNSQNDAPSPKGILFREEEHEDGNFSDTQFLDLMTYMNSDPPLNFQMIEREVTLPDKKASKDVQRNKNKGEAYYQEEADGSSCQHSTGFGMFDGMDFDFGQDLRDAYSQWIEHANPDDYLCLEGGSVEDSEGRTGDQSVKVGVLSTEEELEEGEIVE